MIVYKCDMCGMCGEVHKEIGEMSNVTISHAGTSIVNYPRDGKFQICKECENKLLNILNAWGAEKIIIDAPAPANENSDRYFLTNRCGDSGGNGKDLYKEALREMYLYLHRHNC